MLCFLIPPSCSTAPPNTLVGNLKNAYRALCGPRGHRLQLTYKKSDIEYKLRLPVYTTLYGTNCIICHAETNVDYDNKSIQEIFPLRQAKLYHAATVGSTVSFVLELRDFTSCSMYEFKDAMKQSNLNNVIKLSSPSSNGVDTSHLVFSLPDSFYKNSWKSNNLCAWESAVTNWYNFIKNKVNCNGSGRSETDDNRIVLPSFFTYVFGVEPITTFYQSYEPTTLYWHGKVKNHNCYNLVAYSYCVEDCGEQSQRECCRFTQEVYFNLSHNLQELTSYNADQVSYGLIKFPFLVNGDSKVSSSSFDEIEIAVIETGIDDIFNIFLYLSIDKA
jgi:hypothetical protein